MLRRRGHVQERTGVRQSIKSSKLAGFRVNRRNALTSAAGGVGMLALKQLMAADTASNHGRLSAPTTHHVPRAKSVILLFLNGGPSQMDLFDPKPELTKRHGQKVADIRGGNANGADRKSTV